MDLTQLLAWIVGANTIINFATTVYTLMSARATKALEAIKGLDAKIENLTTERQKAGDAIVERFQGVENRLLKIESDMEHMPDRDLSHRLELAIEKLSGKMETLDKSLTGRMDTLDERMKPVATVTTRLQNYLMEQGAEK